MASACGIRSIGVLRGKDTVMLVLTRRPNETIVLPACGVTVRVLSAKSNAVRVGIEAPPEVAVLRGEVHDRQKQWAAPDASAPVLGLANRRVETARMGLAEAQRLLAAGQTAEAAETLQRIDEDLVLLERRLGGAPAAHVAPGGPRRALIVEDNPNERELLALFLRNAGLDVDTACDGSDALDYLHTHSRPDVVLLDMGLPRMDGQTVVRKVRQDPAYEGLKIFAITGMAPDKFSVCQGLGGVDRWYHKPVDPADLVRGMRQDLQTAAPPR
jgi:two-component system, OmpR family, response regulator